MKINALHILGKKYSEIENLIQRTDITPEMEKFLNGNYPPILSAVLKEKEFYFFNYKINQYKITFFQEKLFEIQFLLAQNNGLALIQFLIENFPEDFKYYLKEDFEITKWKHLTDDRPLEEQNIQVKTKRLNFDCSKKFEIKNIIHYEVLTFENKDFQLKIMPPKTSTNNSHELYYFELKLEQKN